MRLPVLPCVLLLLSGPVVASADTIIPPTTDSFVWDNGDTKGFELTWDGSQAVFSVEDLGTSYYSSLADCCTTMFDRVRTLHPGATLAFSGLAINTYPIDTVFVDNLDFTLFKEGALDNLGLLSGLITLQWDDPFARMATLAFTAGDGSGTGPLAFSMNLEEGGVSSPDTTPAPEPGTLVLVGGGLLAAAIAMRRRIHDRSARSSRP